MNSNMWNLLIIFLLVACTRGYVNISCSTIANDFDKVIKGDEEQIGEFKTYTYNGKTYHYYYNPFYYYNYDDNDNNNIAVSLPIKNNLVKFLVNKVLTKSNQWKKIDQLFKEGIVQDLNIRYKINFPCTEKSKGNQTVTVVWSKNNALNGILKGLQSKRHKLEVDISVKYKDGFDSDCDERMCTGNPSDGKAYEPVFCHVTNMLYLEWRSRNNLLNDYYDYDTFDLTQCKSETSVEQTIQFIFFQIAMGILHLITFILLAAYRRKIRKLVVTQVVDSQKKMLLFWSFIISLWTIFFYMVVFAIYYKTSSAAGPLAWLVLENFYFILSIGISAVYVMFFMVLHLPVAFCCMDCCGDNYSSSSTDLCIPDTCFSCCSRPFQSIAFYVLNSIPHIILMLITMLILEFSNSPVPSVTVLVYSVILLFANIAANAYTLYLMTSFCKTKDGWCRKIGKRCCYFLFGIVVALVTNILTILVVISLVDFLFSDTEETNYTALIPGVLVTVAGWYFSGDITKYTGITIDDSDHGSDGSNSSKKYEIPTTAAAAAATIDYGGFNCGKTGGSYKDAETYRNNEAEPQAFEEEMFDV